MKTSKLYLVLAMGIVAALVVAAPLTAAAQSNWNWVSGSIRTGLKLHDAGQPVRVLQGDLDQFGFQPGPVDGYFGPQTMASLQRFQRSQGLNDTGTLNQATFDALMTMGGWAVPATGTDNGSHQGQYTMTMTATAYGPNYVDNYPYGPVDYYGEPLRQGVVAVDPDVIPLGTHMWVSGYDSPYLPAGGFEAVARDTGGAINGNRIDIFIDADYNSVQQFGVQTVTVTVLD